MDDILKFPCLPCQLSKRKWQPKSSGIAYMSKIILPRAKPSAKWAYASAESVSGNAQ